MSDRSHVHMSTSTDDAPIRVEYADYLNKVLVDLGIAQAFLTPEHAADLVDQLTAALDVYASTLKAVA
ncbi:hypothetical protein ACFWPK_17855 [Nocardia sp. NPDC058519]|uniref:hypothetical protein n=1 Tax=Nocardia sp. NPDC058519 TaxID=3346535 RepID=UPI0036530C4D